MKKESIIALLHGPDQPGIVSQVASWIFERGGNIDHADQHKDTEANIFFQRVEWVSSDLSQDAIEAEALAFKNFVNFLLSWKCSSTSFSRILLATGWAWVYAFLAFLAEKR